MEIKKEERKRILARLTAQELSSEELGLVRGSADDNQDVGSGCGCGGGPSTALATTPAGVEDA